MKLTHSLILLLVFFGFTQAVFAKTLQDRTVITPPTCDFYKVSNTLTKVSLAFENRSLKSDPLIFRVKIDGKTSCEFVAQVSPYAGNPSLDAPEPQNTLELNLNNGHHTIQLEVDGKTIKVPFDVTDSGLDIVVRHEADSHKETLRKSQSGATIFSKEHFFVIWALPGVMQYD